MCLLDEHSKPSLTADLEAEIESYFIVGSSRIDMIAKCMDIDNEIGGYNFDIPVLKDTARAVSEVKDSQSMKSKLISCLARENSRHFETLTLVALRHDVWDTDTTLLRSG